MCKKNCLNLNYAYSTFLIAFYYHCFTKHSHVYMYFTHDGILAGFKFIVIVYRSQIKLFAVQKSSLIYVCRFEL